MGMHVFSYLKQTLKRKEKTRDADWDFGARQSSPVDATASASTSTSTTRRDSRTARAGASGSMRRRRSASLDDPRQPYSPLMTLRPQQQQQQREEERQEQHTGGTGRRVSAAVQVASGSGTSDVNGPRGSQVAHAQNQPDSRVSPASPGGPRSGSPEDDVLLAAGVSAKEVRSSAAAGKQADKRRRAHSMAPVTGLFARPPLQHGTTALTTRDGTPVPSSPTRPSAASPTPSVQSFHSAHAGPSDASRRAALLASKRSMPQLHNVWENFLEEAAEDVQSFSFPMPPHSPTKSPTKYATVHARATTTTSNIANRQLHHTPTSSSSSASTATTTPSVSTVRNPAPEAVPRSPSPKRSRGHMRASHQTSSSTSSTTTSTHGSTSSMAAFSSASSMTTAPDDCDEGSQAYDDPVPPTPRSTAQTSPRGFKFSKFSASADHSYSPSSPIAQQRLRKSPTTPALHYQSLQRGVSPTSSTSSESCGLVSPSHSQSTTPTPSSACPTPSPTPYGSAAPSSHIKFISRLSPVNSRASGQYRRTPETELPEQPLSPGSTKGQKSSTISYRYSSTAGRSQVELRSFPAHEEEDGEEVIDEDVLSELGYYNSSSLRGKIQLQRQSIQSSTFSSSSSSSSSLTPSGSSLVPPLRRSSRQHLRTVVSHSIDSLPLPRAKSASNIRHEALQRPPLGGSQSAPPLPAAKENGILAAASPGAPVYLRKVGLPARPLNHTRSQTLQHAQQSMMVDASSSNNIMAASPTKAGTMSMSSSSRPGQGRLRSGSTSMLHTLPQAKAPPARPPPAPPLDMNPTRLQPPAAAGATGRPSGPGSAAASPLAPGSAVHFGYAL